MKTKLAMVYLIVNVVLLIVSVLLILFKVSIDEKNYINVGQIIILLQMIYFGLSFKIVGARYKAVILLLGNPVEEVGSGFALVPFGIAWLEMIPGTVMQMQIPGEPEQIERRKDVTTLDSGKVWPIRVMTAFAEVAILNHLAFKDVIEKDPLNKRMTLEVSGYIRLKIKDSIVYIKNLGNIKELKKQVRDTFEAIMAVEFGTRTPGLVTVHLKDINDHLMSEMKGVIEGANWGLEVETVQLVSIDHSHTLNIALRDASSAKVDIQKAESEQQQVIIKASGEKQKKTLEGEGAAAAEKAMLVARGEGLEKLAKVASTQAGKVALQLQLANETVAKAQYSIVGLDMAGLAAGVQETLQKIGSAGKKTSKVGPPAPIGGKTT